MRPLIRSYRPHSGLIGACLPGACLLLWLCAAPLAAGAQQADGWEDDVRRALDGAGQAQEDRSPDDATPPGGDREMEVIRGRIMAILDGTAPGLADITGWSRARAGGDGPPLLLAPEHEPGLERAGASWEESATELSVTPDIEGAELEILLSPPEFPAGSRLTASRFFLAGSYVVLDNLLLENERGRLRADRVAAPASIMGDLVTGQAFEGSPQDGGGHIFEATGIRLEAQPLARGSRRFSSRLDAIRGVWAVNGLIEGERGEGEQVGDERITIEHLSGEARFAGYGRVGVERIDLSLSGAAARNMLADLLDSGEERRNGEPDRETEAEDLSMRLEVSGFEFLASRDESPVGIAPPDASPRSGDEEADLELARGPVTIAMEQAAIALSHREHGRTRLEAILDGQFSAGLLSGAPAGEAFVSHAGSADTKLGVTMRLDAALADGRLLVPQLDAGVASIGRVNVSADIDLPVGSMPDAGDDADAGTALAALRDMSPAALMETGIRSLSIQIRDLGGLSLLDTLLGASPEDILAAMASPGAASGLRGMAIAMAAGEAASLAGRLRESGALRLSADFESAEPVLTALPDLLSPDE